jgi:hypothetical protein
MHFNLGNVYTYTVFAAEWKLRSCLQKRLKIISISLYLINSFNIPLLNNFAVATLSTQSMFAVRRGVS